MKSERIDWIDAAKGLGMILIMLGHVGVPQMIRKELYTFHVPLFFFLSGLLFVYNKYNGFDEFIHAKINSLVKPYFYFSIINYLYWVFIARFHNETYDSNSNAKDIWATLIAMIYDIRGNGYTFYNSTLWFITCLFIASIFLYFIVTKAKNKFGIIAITLFIISLIGFYYSSNIKVAQLWNVDASITAVVFLGLGYLAKNLTSFLDRWSNIIFFPLFALANYYIGFYNIPIDMFTNQYGNYFRFYLSALFGIAAILSLNKIIAKSKILIYIGKNSFIYLAFHQFVAFPIITKIFYKLNIFCGQELQKQILFSSSIVILTLILMVPIIYAINNYFPFLLGKVKVKEMLNKNKFIKI